MSQSHIFNKIQQSIVLITGGASGIGLSMTKHFVNLDAFVFICDLNSDKGLQVEKDFSGNVKFIQCDITKESEVENMFKVIREVKGRLDSVINSAGISGAQLIASTKSVHKNDYYELIWKINTFGTFLVSKHAAKLMIEKSDSTNECNGNIVMISSVAGIEGQRGQTAYSSSKGAVLGMVLPMARDLGKYKIRVNAICPGIIYTPMTDKIIDSGPMQSIINQTPLKCFGKPEHIAKTAEFIIVNNFVNGTQIRVDGGVRFPQF